MSPDSSPSESPPSDRTTALALLAVTLAAYAPALGAGFIWDDPVLVVELPQPTWQGLERIWTGKDWPDYFPVTYTSFWIERRLFGTSPVSFHLVNVLLHALSAVLVGRLLRNLGVPGAWLAAAIFAVHPVNVPSVAWVSERKNTLSLLFYLLALQRYLAARQAANQRREYAQSLGAYVLALLSKTSTVSLPVTLLGCIWWRKRRLDWRDMVSVLPFVLLALALGLVTIWFQHTRALAGELGRTDGLPSRLAVAGWAIWFYLSKVLLPIHLSVVYPRWSTPAGFSIVALLPALAIVLATALFWRARERWGRAPLLVSTLYFAHLLPVLGFVQMSYMRLSLVADQWQYLGAIAVIAAAAAGAARLSQRWLPAPRSRFALALAVVALLGGATFYRARLFRDEVTVWQAEVAQHPSFWFGHKNLAMALGAGGRNREADPHYREGLRLAPAGEVARIRRAFGLHLTRTGRADEALPLLRQAVVDDPSSSEVHNTLGVALLSKRELDAALAHFSTAASLRPDEPDPRINIGATLYLKGDLAGAIESYRKAVALGSKNPEAPMALAGALAESGRLSEAISIAESTLSRARANGDNELTQQIAARLATFRARQTAP